MWALRSMEPLTAGAFAQEPAKVLLAGIAAHGMIGSTVR